MSLKVFHIFFVLMVSALAVVCAIWSFQNQTPPVMGYCSIGALVLTLIYGVWFYRKARHIIT